MLMTKPLIKRSHHVLFNASGDVCIGEIPGRSKIIAGAPDWARAALPLLDGLHTPERIVKKLSAEGVQVTLVELTSLIDRLFEFNLLEDGGYRSTSLSCEEIERYDRQILQFGLVDHARLANGGCYQERLKESRVLILGMGGWGTWSALNLARLGIGTLRIVDGDVVELSNLNRQVLYTQQDIGQSKVTAAANAIRSHNPNVTVEEVPCFAECEPAALSELLLDVDLVVVAWASLGYYRRRTVERLLHGLAEAGSIPVMELGGDPLQVSAGPIYLNDGTHPTFEEVRSRAQDAFYSQNPLVKSFQEMRLRNEFQDGSRCVNAWQSAPSLSVMGGLAADQIVKVLTGHDTCNLVGKRFYLSLQTYQTHLETIFEQSR